MTGSSAEKWIPDNWSLVFVGFFLLNVLGFTPILLQDANECWTQFVRILQQKLPGVTSAQTDDGGNDGGACARPKSLIDQYFGKFNTWARHFFK